MSAVPASSATASRELDALELSNALASAIILSEVDKVKDLCCHEKIKQVINKQEPHQLLSCIDFYRKAESLEILKTLVLAGADVNIAIYTSLPFSETATHKSFTLLRAASAFNVEAVKFCLEKGADVNVVDESRNNALNLIAGKATLKDSNSMSDWVKLAELFVEMGVDINNGDDRQGTTPLIKATSWCQEEQVSTLLKLGADANLVNLQFNSALLSLDFEHRIVDSYKLDKDITRRIARMLIIAGVDINEHRIDDRALQQKNEGLLAELIIAGLPVETIGAVYSLGHSTDALTSVVDPKLLSERILLSIALSPHETYLEAYCETFNKFRQRLNDTIIPSPNLPLFDQKIIMQKAEKLATVKQVFFQKLQEAYPTSEVSASADGGLDDEDKRSDLKARLAISWLLDGQNLQAMRDQTIALQIIDAGTKAEGFVTKLVPAPQFLNEAEKKMFIEAFESVILSSVAKEIRFAPQVEATVETEASGKAAAEEAGAASSGASAPNSAPKIDPSKSTKPTQLSPAAQSSVARGGAGGES